MREREIFRRFSFPTVSGGLKTAPVGDILWFSCMPFPHIAGGHSLIGGAGNSAKTIS